MADKVVYFEGLGDCFYEIVEFRNPKAKEYYLSGAMVQAWKSYADFSNPYYVVRPVCHALPVKKFVRGAPITN